MNDIIQFENKYYIAVNSTYADDRVRVLNHIHTFGIFDRWGDIRQIGEEVQGIYYNGMRFVSELEMRINSVRPLLLSSSVKETNEILSIDLTNPQILATETTESIAKDMLYFGRSKFIQNSACFERIRLNNYSHEYHEFELSISVNADFKDIFEVRGMKRKNRGEIFEIKHTDDNCIVISYIGLDNITRSTKVHFSKKPDTWEQHNRAIFRIELKPQQQIFIEFSMHFLQDDDEKNYRNYNEARKTLETEIKNLNDLFADVTTSNEHFTKWIKRSQFDLTSLLSQTENGIYPFAGVPWYNTAFGRDGIITALETLWLASEIARDVLLFLAATQATETNALQDAEPGKIVHEIRNSEMANLGEVPFKMYYGTIDATPLFVVLAGAYFRRTNDIDTINKIWPNIEAALRWINQNGDGDVHHFLSYRNKNEDGLENQGWKDSYDSISDEHGNLATPPITLCEVQGYVYDAKKKAAVMAMALGMKEQAAMLEKEAEDLRQAFNEQFWDEDLQCYAIALDGNKNPCRVVSSNAGHCLFSGIADDDKAWKLARRFFEEDMYTGWGLRTLSSKESRYNPMSYHNGSVWPHDVAILAAGLSKYGLTDEALKLTNSLFEASLFLDMQRLPELFCGFGRRAGEGPTGYPVACSPQAWAVGAVFILLEACLRIDIIAAEKKIYFNQPRLPHGVDNIRISNLKLTDGYADLELCYQYDKIKLDVKNCPQNWEILLLA